MKQLLFFVLIVSLVSCDHFRAATSQEKTYDTATVKRNISNALDSMHMAFKSRNINSMLSYLADDGKYLGTDPTEIWTKQQFGENIAKMFADSANIDYTVGDRIIMVDDDGKSAIVVEQFLYNSLSSKIQVRGVGRTDFKDGKWLIDFYSWNLIPKNEDLKKLNDALDH